MIKNKMIIFCAKYHTFDIKYIKLLNLITLRFKPFVLSNIIISKYRIICILSYSCLFIQSWIKRRESER